MQLHIRHETLYAYDQPVRYSIQTLRLTPRRDPGQRILSWRIDAPGDRIEQTDAFGNTTHLVTVDGLHREMRIVVSGVAQLQPETEEAPPTTGGLSPLAYLATTPLTVASERIRDLARRSFGHHPPDLRTLDDLSATICDAIRYVPGATDVEHSAAEALELGEGVCQDQAHAFIACCRAAGVPARYVSGYFYPGEHESVASHAWVDVWLGSSQGWVSIDVTHRERAGPRHCRLAVGRDYLDAAPVRGVRRGGGDESMHVSVKVSIETQQ
jgi:transglutaminase-like putative cysteine protease